MRWLLLILFWTSLHASPTMWYVRADGGTPTQCTGHTNAAYPGSGTAQACAYSHPFYLTATGGTSWAIAGGDVVQFSDPNPDTAVYQMGEELNGVGQDWHSVLFNVCNAANTASPDCHLPVLPSGIATSITAWSISGNVATFTTAAQSYVAGQTIFLTDFSTSTFFNGIKAVVSVTGLSSTSFQIPVTHANGSATEAGTVAQPTRFLGANAGACHTSGHTGLSHPTQFQAINGAFGTVLLSSVEYVDVECIDITQHDTCTQQGEGEMNITNTAETSPGVKVYAWTFNNGANINTGEFINVTGTTNGGGTFNVTNKQIASMTGFGTSSGTFTINDGSGTVASAADTGSTAFAGACVAAVNNFGQHGFLAVQSSEQGPSNSYFADLGAHGLGKAGWTGSKFNATANDFLTITDFYAAGNGGEDFNSDSANGCGATACESKGTMNMSNWFLQWAGAVEVEPNGGTIGGNGFNYLVDQTFNGNGDCLVMIATAGTWNWNNIKGRFCGQDGFDGLHMGDDQTATTKVNATGIDFQNIEGQTIKLGGTNVLFQNSLGVSNCAFPLVDSFPLNPPGWNALVGVPGQGQGTCRADDGMTFSINDGDTYEFDNITNITDQNTMIDLSGTGCTNAGTCILKMRNFANYGFLGPANGYTTLPGGIFFGSSDPFANAGSVLTNNNWFNVRGGTCPQDPAHELNAVCTDPKFTAESAIDAMNIVPLPGSPLIGAGATYVGVPATDIFGVAYSSPPPIGAAMPATSTSASSISGGAKLSGGAVLH